MFGWPRPPPSPSSFVVSRSPDRATAHQLLWHACPDPYHCPNNASPLSLVCFSAQMASRSHSMLGHNSSAFKQLNAQAGILDLYALPPLSFRRLPPTVI